MGSPEEHFKQIFEKSLKMAHDMNTDRRYWNPRLDKIEDFEIAIEDFKTKDFKIEDLEIGGFKQVTS